MFPNESMSFSNEIEVESSFATKLLNMSEAQLRKLENAKRRGLCELAPVVLPEGENLLGANKHFGWPVATKAGDALVVVYARWPQHYGGNESPDKYTSWVMMVRSIDGGRTWSKPFDLRELIRKDKTPSSAKYLGSMIAICTTQDGGIVVVGGGGINREDSGGVFRSDDEGQTWQHFPDAYTTKQLKGPAINAGARIIEHPEYGLVIFGHTASHSHNSPLQPFDTWVRYSRDGGRTWKEIKMDIDSFARPAEPVPLLHEGALFIVGRCHDDAGFDPANHTWRHVQLWSKSGWFPLKAKICNIRVTDMGKGGKPHPVEGMFSQDTVDLSFNPVTKRLEVVATNRNGGGEGRYHKAKFSLNLWSISPEALLTGSSEWRFECTFFERKDPKIMHRGMTDGCHPAGAVIDEENGVQHIFVYMGSPQGPSGIFRLTRTLDTEKLRAFLND